jgi:hypothetical protein
VAAIQGTRIYDTFGNWRESQADQKRCSRKRRPKSEDGNANRKDAFEWNNYCKHRNADTRRRELAVIALPLFQKFKDAGGKRLGRAALRKMLHDAGHVVSDWESRWLVKNLPAMDTRTAFEMFVARRTLDIACRRQERLEMSAIKSSKEDSHIQNEEGLPALIGSSHSANLQFCSQDQNVADVSDGEHVRCLRNTEVLAESDSIEVIAQKC